MKSGVPTSRPNRHIRRPLRTPQQLTSNARQSVLKGHHKTNHSHDLQMEYSWQVQFFPVLFFEAYLFASVLAFTFGPVDFPVRSPWLLYSYLTFAQLAIFVGYYAGAARPPCGYQGLLSVKSVFALATIITLLLLPLTIHFRNYAELSLVDALYDPGAAYSARIQELANRESVSKISLLRGIVGPFLGLLVPVGILYSHSVSRQWRRLWKLAVVGIIIEALLVGAAKGLFDLVLTVPWLIWIRATRSPSRHNFQTSTPTLQDSSRYRHQQWRRTLIRKVAVALATVILVGAGIMYFAHSRQSRYGLGGNEYPPWTTGWSETDYGIRLPAGVEYTVYTINRYWSQGYFGLSECFGLPFEWCYGCGHSQVMMRYAGNLLADPEYFWNRCYPVRLEDANGYEVAHYWHTIYPWLASDLTFPGAIVFMGLMAFLLSRAWADTLLGKNPYAAGFTTQLLLLFFYIPANNIRLMYSEEALTFWGLLGLWLMTRKR